MEEQMSALCVLIFRATFVALKINKANRHAARAY